MADDFFALLGQPRQPWLDPERVKEAFHVISRERHPDLQAGGGDVETDTAFARLNAAQTALREPKTRLRCLLEIEYPEIRISGPAAVPGALAELFAPITALMGQIDALLARKATSASALTRALLAREEMALQEAAQEQLDKLSVLNGQALEELQTFGAGWEPSSPDAAAGLLGLYLRFAYLSRWTDQLRERLFQLAS